MAKITRALMLKERRCGLKYFDKAVELIGKAQLIENAVAINIKLPDIWDRGWSNFKWAFANAVSEAINPKGDILQTYNIDDVLLPTEMEYVANKCGFNIGEYIPSRKRK